MDQDNGTRNPFPRPNVRRRVEHDDEASHAREHRGERRDGRVRILVVDDHKVVRLGLKTLFGTVPRCEVVGEAGTAAEAIEIARRYHPDVVLMDVRLPDESGVEACREIRSVDPDTRVIMLTSFADESAVMASITAGAVGYLLKQSDLEHLVEAVEIVADGGSLLDPTVTKTILSWLQRAGTHPPDDPLATLSEQERKVLPLMAEGKTNREIGKILCLSEHTVKTYVSNILQKLHLARRGEAAAYLARQRGLGPTGGTDLSLGLPGGRHTR
jgi:two-component system response regulator DevR